MLELRATPPIVLAYPGPKDTVSGGYEYDRELCAGLRRLGLTVSEISFPSGFPFPDNETISTAIAQIEQQALGSVILLDGLAASSAPELCIAARNRGPLLLLIHHPLADEVGLTPDAASQFAILERKAIQQADWLVVTSDFTRGRLISDYGAPEAKIQVAEPGVMRGQNKCLGAETGLNSDPGAETNLVYQLLCVGSITPRKGHLALFKALMLLDRHGRDKDAKWHLSCVGPLNADPDHSKVVQEAAKELGERVSFTGSLNREDLAAHYAKSDLLISAASFEGFGMAVAEAIAVGLPVIGFEGGALQTTHAGQAADLVANNDVEALSARLERFMHSSDYRIALRDRARGAQEGLTDWDHTARMVQRAYKAALEQRSV